MASKNDTEVEMANLRTPFLYINIWYNFALKISSSSIHSKRLMPHLVVFNDLLVVFKLLEIYPPKTHGIIYYL